MIKVTWEEVDNYVNALVDKLLSRHISGVYGIPKGGLCIAVMLSYKLGIPLLLAPCEDCIVVDDIADTGITLKHYASKGYYISTMYYHRQSEVIPNFWIEEKTDEWISFPWER